MSAADSCAAALRVLPPAKRRAIQSLCALAAAMDDCTRPGGDGAAGLDRWTAEVHQCYSGRASTAVGRAVAETVHAYPIPRSCFEEMAGGRRLDLAPTRYPTFAALRAYCEHSTSALLLAAIEVLGYDEPATRDYVVDLGVAVRLCRILDELASDAAVGRLYLPVEDLEQHGVEPDALQASLVSGAAPPAGTDELLRATVERAQDHLRRAAGFLPPADRRAMLSAEVLSAATASQLELLDRRPWPPRPVGLGTAQQAWIAVRTSARVLRPRASR